MTFTAASHQGAIDILGELSGCMVSTDNGFKRILWAQFLLILENSLISCEHNLNIPQLPAEY